MDPKLKALLAKMPRKDKEKLAGLLAEKARREAKKKQAAPGGLLEFVKYFWDVLEPNTPFVDGWAIQAICEHLEAVTAGNVTRILMNVPPGFAKSILTNVFHPAWEWGPMNQPHQRYVTFSYASHLTERDNARFRDLIRSRRYQMMYGDRFKLVEEGKVKVANDKTGWKFASSVGGVGTGERGTRVLCLPRNQRILTNIGWIEIGRVVEEKLAVKVAGFDHATNAPVWQDIEDYERNPGNEIYEVRCEGGSVRCTGDHPVYVQGRGYARADSLTEGEQLVWAGGDINLPAMRRGDTAQTEPQAEVLLEAVSHSLRESTCAEAQFQTVRGLRQERVQAARTLEEIGSALLQPRMPRQGIQRGCQPSVSRRLGNEVVREVRRAVFGKAKRRGKCSPLLSVLRNNDKMGSWGFFKKAVDREKLQTLRKTFHAILARQSALLANLRERKPFAPHRWEWQWALCAREDSATIPARVDTNAQSRHSGAGWQSLPAVREGAGWKAGPARSPHRLQQRQLESNELDNAVQVLSRQDARGQEATRAVETRTVVSVESVGWEDVVYNVRVGPCHNYYAEGILCHNCDDPHAVSEAESKIVRQATVRWFRETMSNRLNDITKDAIVVIMQRVHDEDVSGSIITDLPEYEHVCIPMEFDTARACSTSIGWSDPRSEQGELAWPERYPASSLAGFKKQPIMWAGQYQQSPEERGGGIFKRDWWEPIECPMGKPLPVKFDFILASVDTAYTKKEKNDPSAMTVWGVYADRFGQPRVMLLAAWEKWLHLSGKVVEKLPGESERSYQRRAQPEWGLVEWILYTCRKFGVDRLIIEAKASGQSADQELRKLVGGREFGIELSQVKGDKEARAEAVTHLFSEGLVSAPAEIVGDNYEFRDWAQLLINQMAVFPRGRDDLTDSATQALKHLRDRGLLMKRAEKAEDDLNSTMYRSDSESAALYPG